MKKRYLFILLLVTWNLLLFAQGERITNYDISILINQDRSIEVTETIDVTAQGRTIKRGIVRRLPTYQNGRGVRYQDIEVLKNGRTEPFHTESEGNDLSIYIGESDVYIDPGAYTYTIRYRVPNQVRFFDDFDEIYWNAVGTDWEFPVDAARCTLQLLDSMKVLQTACYTGPYGEQDQNCSIRRDSSRQQVIFELTRPLATREGFTVALGFQKGLIQEPSLVQRYTSVIVLGVGCLSLILFFLYTTFKYGIDPPKPSVYALFEPPQELSAASIGYLLKEKYDPDLLTATLIDLAVKGYIYIDQSEEPRFLLNTKVYRINRLKKDPSALPVEEKALLSELFEGEDSIEIDGSYDSTLRRAVQKFRKTLKSKHRTFMQEGNNRKLVNISIIGTVLFGIISFIFLIRSNGRYGAQIESEAFMVIFIITMSFMLYAFLSNLSELLTGLLRVVVFMFVMLFIISFFNGETTLFFDYLQELKEGLIALKDPILKIFTLDFLYVLWGALTSTYLNMFAFFLFVLFAVASISVYRFVIKKPSKAKQQLRSELEGFKLYLEMTEKDRLELLNPPERTPSHFEAMLPYAYALDLTHQWSEQFKDQLEQAAYEPKWSNSQSIYYNSGSFDRSFGRSLSSSATPPSSSSSSGSSGGGSSGGGGGGGGGGGW